MLTKDEATIFNESNPIINQFKLGLALQYGVMTARKEITSDARAGVALLSEPFPFDIVIHGMSVLCTESNGSGTARLYNDAGVAISDAVACATADAIANAATIDVTYMNIDRGKNLYIRTNGAGDRGIVSVTFSKRNTN